MSGKVVSLDAFQSTFGTEIELSSVALGGQIIGVSDEFFAEAENLIKVEAAPSLKGQFGPNGALYSGWETRRHNGSGVDWCLIKLGAVGAISGFDIDTSHFNGNEAPEVSIEALLDIEGDAPAVDHPKWTTVLERVPLGPNSRHLFKLNFRTAPFNHVKLNMYPDGGIARFRVYGLVEPVFPDNDDRSIDLAHVYNGGRVVFVSDQHFGVGSNLLLPGRGKDMGDGWETKRSRTKEHKDWVIIKLGCLGSVEKLEIDTAHFKGNYPESCEVHAVYSSKILPEDNEPWECILPRAKLQAHHQHFFDVQISKSKVISHVKVTMYPDGGMKRVRVTGRRAVESVAQTIPENKSLPATPKGSNNSVLYAEPLSSEAFAPYGHVVQAYKEGTAPSGTKITPANQGSASKFHKLSPIASSYPQGSGANPGLSVYRCKPLDFDFKADQRDAGPGWSVRLLERHLYTNQAFIPMGIGSGKELSGPDALERQGRAYLVVVAHNGDDDRPDLSTLKAFVAGAGQTVVYATGIWHHPMVTLETTMDFTCVETQIGDGSRADCEVVDLDKSKGYPSVKIESRIFSA